MPDALVLRLLSREDCHLCEVAQRALDSLGAVYELVDVDDDKALLQRYGDLIPVLLYGEQEVARAPIDRDLLRHALQGLDSASR